MTMKDFIEQEKRRLQESLHWFNSRGSRMTVRESGDLFLDTLVDSFTVTRIAPHFDAAGNHLRTDFWLLWKALGYDEGFQHAHTIKVVSWSQDDTYLLDLLDDRDRRFHIELIFPDQEPNQAADWKRWRDYKAGNRDRFERIDAGLLTEHTRIAEEWE